MRDAAIVDVVRRHAIRLDVETAAQRLLERWARHELDLPETYPTGV